MEKILKGFHFLISTSWRQRNRTKSNYRFLGTEPYDFRDRFARASLDAFSSPVIKISEKSPIRQLSVFRPCVNSDLRPAHALRRNQKM